MSDKNRIVAVDYGIVNTVVGLDAVLEREDVDAVILATPTGLHAAQTQAVLAAGKHVQVEIPLADSLADAGATLAVAEASDRVAMVGHTRRFNPSHQFVHQRIEAADVAVQQMGVQTYLFRRTNTNAKGEERSWIDHLLWHHAAQSLSWRSLRWPGGSSATVSRTPRCLPRKTFGGGCRASRPRTGRRTPRCCRHGERSRPKADAAGIRVPRPGVTATYCIGIALRNRSA